MYCKPEGWTAIPTCLPDGTTTTHTPGPGMTSKPLPEGHHGGITSTIAGPHVTSKLLMFLIIMH